METQKDRNNIERYKAALETAMFIAEDGNMSLALEVTRDALEKLYLEKEVNQDRSPDDEEKVKKIELLLTQKYFDFRSRIEKKNPYLLFLLKSLTVVVLLSLSIMTMVYIGSSKMADILRPALTEKIDNRISQAFEKSDKLDAMIESAIEKAVDRSIDKKLTQIFEEKIIRKALGKESK